MTVGFDDYDAAVAADRAVAQAGLYPSNYRLLDAAEAFINAGTAVAGGLLLLAFGSADHPVDAWLVRALELARDHGGVVLASRVRSEQSARADDDASQALRSSFLRIT